MITHYLSHVNIDLFWHLVNTPAAKHRDVILQDLSDLSPLLLSPGSFSSCSSCALTYSCWPPYLHFPFSLLAQIPAGRHILAGLTIHAGPAESLLAWLCSHHTQQDFSLKQERRPREGINPTASELAICLPLFIPPLKSSHTSFNSPAWQSLHYLSLTPLIRAYQI